MKHFTIIGDLHCENSNLDLVEQIFEEVESLGNPAIWLGDLLDTKEVIRGKSLNTLYDLFKQSRHQHIVIVGNHDYFNLECKDHSLRVLGELDNVFIVNSLREIDGLFFVPYIHDTTQLRETLAKIPDNATVFGHFELNGFDFGTGYFCEGPINLMDFKRFKKVISGHFHKYQEQDNFTYLGTPFSHSFGESNQIKYLAVLKGDDLCLQETNYPRHITRTVTENLPDDLESLKEEKHYIRLIIKNKNILLDKAKFPNIQVIEDFEVVEDLDFNLKDTDSNEKKFQEWGHKQLDTETLELGLQILKAF